MAVTGPQLDFFMQHVLNIDDPLSRKAQDPVAFLHLVAESLHRNVPFTNVWDSWNSQTLGPARHKDNELQMYSKPYFTRMLAGQGATCVTLSHVLMAVLERIGFNCYVGMALTKNRPGMEMLHFITFVENVRCKGDTWLIDPGTRIAPLFQAVCLGDIKKDTVHPGRSSFVENKFTYSKEADRYQRWFSTHDNPTKWTLFYEFNTEDYTLNNHGKNDYHSFYVIHGKKLFTEYMDSRKGFDTNVTTFWESNFILSGYPNGKGVLFVNNRCQIENEEGVLDEIVCTDKRELLRLVIKFYPTLKTPEFFMYIDKFWRSKYDSKL